MSWKDKMKDWGGGEVNFLSEDGEVIIFAVVGEPFLIKGKFRGKETERIGAPIVTVEGFSLLVVGKRVARRLSKYEDHFRKYAFELVRHGAANDTDTTYELTRTEDKALEQELIKAAAASKFTEEIADAVKAAEEIATG